MAKMKENGMPSEH